MVLIAVASFVCLTTALSASKLDHRLLLSELPHINRGEKQFMLFHVFSYMLILVVAASDCPVGNGHSLAVPVRDC